MGRGGVPNKVGGFISVKDYRQKIFILGKNVSIFQFLKHGCFEKDLLSYCANRLSDYSCIHWVDENINGLDADLPVDALDINSTSSNSICITMGLQQSQVIQIITQIILPIIVVSALISAVLVMKIMISLSKFHPLCRYLSIIAGFDLVELVVQGGDLTFEAFFNIKIVSAFQFISRSICQMLPLFYNILKQGQSFMYIGLAIDSCRFILHTRDMSIRYRKEWISNVCILSSVLLLTMNAQFFWTFDVTVNDSKILHGRMVKRSLECGFSTSLPPNQVFANFIWPFLDHFAGETLPFVISITCAITGYMFIRKRSPIDPQIEKVSLNPQLVSQTNLAFTSIVFCFSIFTFSRLAYYVIKYSIFISVISRTPNGMRGNFAQSYRFNDNAFLVNEVSNEEILLDVVEYMIKLLSLVFIIIKFFILLLYVKDFRRYITKRLANKCTRADKKSYNNSVILKNCYNESLNLMSFSV